MKIKPFKTSVIAFAGMLLMAGCASTAHIEKAKDTDLTKYKTYSWVEDEKKPDTKQDKKVNRRKQIALQNVQSAVDKQLEKSGWRKVDENPDVLVSSDLLVEKNQKPQQNAVYSDPFTRTYYNRFSRRFNTYYYPSQFVGYDNYSTTVKEGTVTVTLIDARTDKAVWQGWATNELNQANISDKEIDKNVQSILKSLTQVNKLADLSTLNARLYDGFFYCPFGKNILTSFL